VGVLLVIQEKPLMPKTCVQGTQAEKAILDEVSFRALPPAKVMFEFAKGCLGVSSALTS
jgi:hypothetical protein